MIEPKDHLEEQMAEFYDGVVNVKRYIESLKGKHNVSQEEIDIYKAQLDAYQSDLTLLGLKIQADMNRLVEDL